MDRRELTIRGIILGIAITTVFTAANVYLGLKVGLTFASSIPAAVISMAVLRLLFRETSIYENNIVQTVASSAGSISAIIFVLPGLVMVGWWTGFPYWMTFAICAVGGVLGVMYSIPLRRALVTTSTLPYPAGVAAAEVLKVGASAHDGGAEGRRSLIALAGSAAVAAGLSALTAMKLLAGEIAGYFKSGAAATGLGGSFSLALLGAGHLMGLAVGMAMVAGLIIAWGVATPILTSLDPAATGTASEIATAAWRTKVRFIGAGAIGAAALWTLGKLVVPIWRGLVSAAATSRQIKAGHADALPRTERDIPITIVGVVSVLALIPISGLAWIFLQGTALESAAGPLIAAMLPYIIVVGFLVAAVCGYMAGLIGSSNSPVSGVAILAALGAAVLLAMVARSLGWIDQREALVAFTLFVTAIILAIAVIANDNLQDLKTGQLVDATPWRQQVALIVGVIAGSAVIPPILDLLNTAFGFAGSVNAAALSSQPLAAPQAALISTLVKGVVGGDLDWGLIAIGALVGLALVAVDETLRKTSRYSLPPLAAGLAIYLPATVTTPIIIGAVAGHFYNRWAQKQPGPESAKRLGVLMASGLIVGESLFNVALAGLIVFSRQDSPLAVVGDSFEGAATIAGAVAFAAVSIGLYAWTRKTARAA